MKRKEKIKRIFYNGNAKTAHGNGKITGYSEMQNFEIQKRKAIFGLKIARVFSYCDLVCEAADILGLISMSARTAVSFIKKGETPANFLPYGFALTEAISKLNVKILRYEEFMQNAIMTILTKNICIKNDEQIIDTHKQTIFISFPKRAGKRYGPVLDAHSLH